MPDSLPPPTRTSFVFKSKRYQPDTTLDLPNKPRLSLAQLQAHSKGASSVPHTSPAPSPSGFGFPPQWAPSTPAAHSPLLGTLAEYFPAPSKYAASESGESVSTLAQSPSESKQSPETLAPQQAKPKLSISEVLENSSFLSLQKDDVQPSLRQYTLSKASDSKTGLRRPRSVSPKKKSPRTHKRGRSPGMRRKAVNQPAYDAQSTLYWVTQKLELHEQDQVHRRNHSIDSDSERDKRKSLSPISFNTNDALET